MRGANGQTRLILYSGGEMRLERRGGKSSDRVNLVDVLVGSRKIHLCGSGFLPGRSISTRLVRRAGKGATEISSVIRPVHKASTHVGDKLPLGFPSFHDN